MAIEVYKKTVKLPEERLSTAGLMYILQEAAAEHCEIIGYSGDVVGPMGLMWVIVRQRLNVLRYPRPGETLLVRTWPNPDRHGMFPRQYVIESVAGEKLVTACAIWSLVDVESRRMIRPENYGINFGGLMTGEEQSLPRGTVKLPTDRRREFTVPEAYLDVNMHMNNTRYYDLAEDSIAYDPEKEELEELLTEYVSEARLGDVLSVEFATDGEKWYLSGATDKPVFRMNLKYRAL